MELKDFFKITPRAALALSGGVDSTYLLYAARALGADVRPYYVKTAFQPQFELEDAKKAAAFAGTELTVLELDILSAPGVKENPEDRCYYCKKTLFAALTARAEADGYSVLLDGTNASDDVSDRPGMRALTELSVKSPLRECGLEKAEIRRLSEEAGLFTAQKPAYACLATRIPAGQTITAEDLEKVERSENALFEMGYTDFRVRLTPGGAKLQFPKGQLMRAVSDWDSIKSRLKNDFSAVAIDLNGR